MYKKILTLILGLFLFASQVAPALAQTENRLRGSSCLYNGVVTMDCVPILFANAVYWLFIMSGVVAVFFIAYGGIRYLTSSGDAKAVDAARKIITWAIIGLVVILSSFMIVNIIADLTGVRCITKFGFTACGDASRDTDVTRYCTNCVRYVSECASAGQEVGDGTCPNSAYPVCCVPKSDVDLTRHCSNCVRYSAECAAAGQDVGEGSCPDSYPVCCVDR